MDLKSIPGAKALGNLAFFLSPLWLVFFLGFETDLNLFLEASWRLGSSSCLPLLPNSFSGELDSYSASKYTPEENSAFMVEFLPRISWDIYIFPNPQINQLRKKVNGKKC